MKNILFAIDDTPECEKAAEYLIQFFGAMSDCHITLIHVKSEFVLCGDAILAGHEDEGDSEDVRAQKVVDKFTHFFTQKGLNTNAIIKEGEPVQMVLDEAINNYHLLAIGKSADSLFNKIFSSNQDDFITKAPIPVLLIK